MKSTILFGETYPYQDIGKTNLVLQLHLDTNLIIWQIDEPNIIITMKQLNLLT